MRAWWNRQARNLGYFGFGWDTTLLRLHLIWIRTVDGLSQVPSWLVWLFQQRWPQAEKQQQTNGRWVYLKFYLFTICWLPNKPQFWVWYDRSAFMTSVRGQGRGCQNCHHVVFTSCKYAAAVGLNVVAQLVGVLCGCDRLNAIWLVPGVLNVQYN